MVSGKARLVGLFALVVLLLGGGICVWDVGSPRVAAADARDSKIKALLTERHAALKQIASIISTQHNAGQASFALVYEANQAVHRAELDLCETDKERGVVLEKILADAKEFEKHAEAAFKDGRETASAALRAKVNRLEAEIAVERSNAK